jgi:hypothetical protein
MKISTILDQIDVGAMALPQFQRGYVWSRDQVRYFMVSLYRRYPVGSLLVWVTKTENAKVRGEGQLQPGAIELLLDGQQRITSLYGIMRSKPPLFFEGNSQAFTNLYFNLDEEVFEFYSVQKMKNNELWINVSEVMKKGIGEFITPFTGKPEYSEKLSEYITRLSNLLNIGSIELYIERVTGEDKSVDVVVDIFNQVNSGGTKLSKGDLALARVCASWPDARARMKQTLGKWSAAGYNGFRLEWLLRVMTAVISGEAYFSAIKNTDVVTIQHGLENTEKLVDKILNQISSQLGLDHGAVLGSVNSFPVLARFLDNNHGKLKDFREWDKLLYWYIHTLLWGRYAGSTESVMSQDLNVLSQPTEQLDGLIAILRKGRGGDLRINPNDFNSWSVGSRFYPLLYMMTRVQHARDWETGIELTSFLLGKFSRLQVHHIFPKALLYKYGYNRAQVNSIANFTFLTQETNLAVTDRNPSEYIPFYEKKQPGAIRSHWIPMDPDLWKPEKYLNFLEERRILLAEAANQYLDNLYAGTIPAPSSTDSVLDRQSNFVPGQITSESEESELNECNGWMVEHDLPAGEHMYELIDPNTGGSLAYLDLAWPEGVQEKYSQPVAILIDEDQGTLEIANNTGYKCFTNTNDFKQYVSNDIIGSNINGL